MKIKANKIKGDNHIFQMKIWIDWLSAEIKSNQVGWNHGEMNDWISKSVLLWIEAKNRYGCNLSNKYV